MLLCISLVLSWGANKSSVELSLCHLVTPSLKMKYFKLKSRSLRYDFEFEVNSFSSNLIIYPIEQYLNSGSKQFFNSSSNMNRNYVFELGRV